jgi:uncharacterized protein
MYSHTINGLVLYYNPMGYGGVTLVDGRSQQLLNACDGLSTIGEIAESTGRTTEDTQAEVDQLARSEVIHISDEYTEEIHASRRRRPSLSSWLHLTNSCNLACTYCYALC